MISRYLFLVLMTINIFTLPAISSEKPIILMAATSTINVVNEAVMDFQTLYKHQVRQSFAASSTLARQIENGAPAAVYISANTKWVEYLIKSGLVAGHNHKILFGNRLTLITHQHRRDTASIRLDLSLIDYLDGQFLALANPDHTPVGIYAKQSLKTLGLWEKIKGKIARTRDVRSALMLVERQETPLGIVYATDAMSSSKVVVAEELPPESHSPVVYRCALIGRKQPPQAKLLYDFFSSKRAKRIFKRHGFSVETL